MDCSWDSHYFLTQVQELPVDLKRIIRDGSNQEYLDALSAAALTPNLCQAVFTYFEPLAVEICARWSTQHVSAAVQTFGRMLPVLPQLETTAHDFLTSLGDVDILSHLETGNDHASIAHSTALLLGVYRLLCFNNEKFAQFFLPAKLQILLRHDNLALRHLAVKVICQYVHATDAVLEDMQTKYVSVEPAFGDFDGQTIDYAFLSLWESKRLNDFQHNLDSVRQSRKRPELVTDIQRVINLNDFSTNVAAVAGILLPRMKDNLKSHFNDTSVLSNTTTETNLRNIANAFQDNQPVLVAGLAGSGKTTLIRHLAAKLGKDKSMVTLHLNEQSDTKLLVGVYTTGKEPGSFQWQPGVLTSAVSTGRWLFIEDLDRAPSEVMSALLPLIERGELLVPSRGQRIKAKPGFKIIASMRSTHNSRGESVVPVSRMLGRRLWTLVNIECLTSEETKQVIIARCPLVFRIIDQVMAIYDQIIDKRGPFFNTYRPELQGRPISTRELFKWTDRINQTLSEAEQHPGRGKIPESAFDSIFLDAVDCFAGNLRSSPAKQAIHSLIARNLHIDSQRAQYLVEKRSISLEKIPRGQTLDIRIGRSIISIDASKRSPSVKRDSNFALNGFSLRLIERVAVAVKQRESLLLVGETGIGKTATIQHLANLTYNKLIAINLSQQSETGDLLGGLKPVNPRTMAIPLKEEFDTLFNELFSQRKNREFSEQLSKCISKSNWRRALMLWKMAVKKAQEWLDKAEPVSPQMTSDAQDTEQPPKRRKIQQRSPKNVQERINSFTRKLESFEKQVSASANSARFAYVEGKLVNAVREGHWVLLDEINLASPDTLECLADLLETNPATAPFLLLADSGKVDRIEAHPNFRIFAAMNPSTDVGKKDLPLGIRSRFSEVFVESPDQDSQSLQDISKLFLERISSTAVQRGLAKTVADLYQQILKLSVDEALVDGSGQPVHFSLRTLTRALSHAATISSQCSISRALFEGFCLQFFACLDSRSEMRLLDTTKTFIFPDAKTARAEIKKSLRPPTSQDDYVQITLQIESAGKEVQETHWFPRGQMAPEDPSAYIVTPFVYRSLRNLIRASFSRKYPILIQGPTSAGKTSMIEYLAKRSGNKFVRINNHEHTDLQEYLGHYVSTPNGELVFQEGILVQAVRQGHWIVLDELNLAPTDVLEALNRLLDDNRELFLPETQEIIRPHKDFMLFATQNPAGPYGGRKFLSRAFRNRFVELHFGDIPVQELNIILARRSQLPPSWCALIVEVYKRLSSLRQEQRLFEQDSFATLRDLFRWAFRGAESVKELASQGYVLLAAKVRKFEERESVKHVIEQVMSGKGVHIQIDEQGLFSEISCKEMQLYDQSSGDKVIWTRAMRRLFSLTAQAIKNNEPVLLVGETGCGKTTVCQMLAEAMGQMLHVVNAHQNTETADLIGAQRPIRNRSILNHELQSDLQNCLSDLTDVQIPAGADVEILLNIFDSLPPLQADRVPEHYRQRITLNRNRRKALFQWCDGSLVEAMNRGSYYLLDEINLADDSVLERLNSVLDPNRSLLLAEKGTNDSLIVAKEGFQFLATMNPGGDFGKKELSPALRNRFTEIWVPPLSEIEDVFQIVEAKLNPDLKSFASILVEFAKWFNDRNKSFRNSTISVRDLLTWVDFANSQTMPPKQRLLEGAALVYVDTIGANPSALLQVSEQDVETERMHCIQKLSELFNEDVTSYFSDQVELEISGSYLRANDFYIERIPNNTHISYPFYFETPRTKLNAMRIMRALKESKPILIEGNPGVGKSSIVSAMAAVGGRALTRINLSEQTDLMDLFGSDVPVENAEAGTFSWKDAPFLNAMKRGDWVLLDEMNLAAQSVLEGLNACLDHRSEVYIPELDQTFPRHPDFRLFATQNPHHQGQGRKGLPGSFVNRFTVVYAKTFQTADLEQICARCFPSEDSSVIPKLVNFVTQLDKSVTRERRFGARGAPWEFNLRDVLRWLQLITSTTGLLPAGTSDSFVNLLFTQRFRTDSDVKEVKDLYHSSTGHVISDRQFFANLRSKSAQIGLALTSRGLSRPTGAFSDRMGVPQLFPLLESLMLCVQQNWPAILVGHSGSGKSALLLELASIFGAEIEVFALNADIDATDLVGGFEQVDRSRQIHEFIRKLQYFTLQQLQKALLSSDSFEQSLGLESHFAIYHQIQTKTDGATDLAFIVHHLKQVAENDPSESAPLLLEEGLSLLETSFSIENAKFEWVDGILVQALQSGRWLILDHANLCSSAVLDRLNSLLEPGGSLLINEHCNPDGSARIIKPHPNFRIFLTMDPQYGEVSRAMRNRSVELFVPATLVETSVQPWKFTGNVEPTLSGFLELLKIAHYPSSEQKKYSLLAAGTERLSFVEMDLFQRFSNEISRGLGTENIAFSIKRINDQREIMERMLEGWSAAMLKLYRDLDSKLQLGHAVELSQPVYLLTNQPLLNYARRSLPEVDIMKLSEAQKKTSSIAQILVALETSEVLFPVLKARLSGDERRKSDEKAVGTTKVINQAAGLLHSVAESLLQWAKATNGLNNTLNSELAFANDIQNIWWFAFNLISSNRLDDLLFRMLLQVFHDKVEAFSMEANKTLSIRTKMQSLLKPFVGSIPLTTGQSMESYWKIFKPRTAPSIPALQNILILEGLIDEFDKICWNIRAPLEEIKNLKASFANAIETLYYQQTNVEDLLEVSNQFKQTSLQRLIQDGYQNFGSILNQFKTKDFQEESIRLPLFQSTFRWIFEHYKVIRPECPSSPISKDNYSWLEFLACEEIKHLKSTSNENRSYDDLTLLGIQTSPHDSNLWSNIINNLLHSGDACLDQIDLLQVETSVLGHEVATNLDLLLARVEPQFFDSLVVLSENVLSEHAILFSEHFSASLSAHGLRSTLMSVSSRFNLEKSLLNNEHSGNSATRQMLLNFLLPMLQMPFHIDWDRSESLLKLSNCFLAFSLVSILLYMPNHLFDPAIKAQLLRELFDSRKQTLADEVESHDLVEYYLTASTTNSTSELLQQEISGLGQPPALPNVVRPVESRMSEIHVEFGNILRMIGPLFSTWSDNTKQQLHSPALMDNLSSAIGRLYNCPSEYRDITFPAIQLLRCLQKGLNVRAEYLKECESSNAASMSRKPSSCYFLPSLQLNDYNELIELPSREYALSVLKSYALRASLQPLQNWSILTKKELECLLFAFYRQWKSQLEKDRKVAEAKSSLYQYKGGREENDDIDEEELWELFPFSEDESSTTETNASSIMGFPQQIFSLVAETSMNIFLDAKRAEEQWADIIMQSAEVLSNGVSLNTSSRNYEYAVPSIILHIKALKDELHSSGAQKASYNFYTDANISEGRKLTNLIYDVQTKFAEIVKIWPEHATLHNVLSACGEILAFKRTMPVSKLLTKAEQLHSYVAEWQSVTSKQYSAYQEFQRLTDLLIAWRQLELSTWARLLELETQKCIADAQTWWFVAYENIYAMPQSLDPYEPYSKTEVSELLDVVESLIKNSSIGQFQQRLKILKALQKLMCLSTSQSSLTEDIRNGLGNLLEYYQRFASSCEEKIQAGRQELEKKVKEVLKLTSWNDRNVYTLKQSAKASHRKLFKIVRKYRDLLSQPIGPLLEQDMPRAADRNADNDGTTSSIQISSVPNSIAMQTCQLNQKCWNQRPKRMKNISTTVLSMQSMLKIPDDDSMQVVPRVQSFLDNLEGSINELQKETPEILNEDNQTLVKHVLTRKRRLFADTLKQIGMMGFTSNPSSDVCSRQSSLSIALSNLSQFPTQYQLEDAYAGKNLLHSTLHNMTKVRKATTDHHDDVSKSDIIRSVGFLESMLAFALKKHNNFSSLMIQMEKLDSLVSQASELWNESGLNISSHKTSETSQEDTKSSITWLGSVLRVTGDIITAQTELGSFDASGIVQSLTTRALKFDELKKSINGVVALPKHVISIQETHLLGEAFTELKRLLAQIDGWVGDESMKKVSVVLNNLKTWINSYRFTSNPSNGEAGQDVKDMTIFDLDKQTTDTVDLILGSTQDVEKILLSLTEGISESKGWLVNRFRDIQSVVKMLHLPIVTKAMEDLLCRCCQMPMLSNTEEDATLIYACASITVVLPIFQQYQQFIHRVLEYYAKLYRSTCLMAFRLTKTFTVVATKGFCKPSEKSHDQETTSGNLESGTGLGEGEGAEDISKDIGEDEDLSELAQDPNNAKPEGGVKNEADAVDVEDALEGGNAGDESPDTDSEKQQTDEGSTHDSDIESQDGSVGGGEGGADEETTDAKDDEVGDVDDLGPSAVDEKLWDEADDDSTKEKQGTQKTKNLDVSDQAASLDEQKGESAPEAGSEDGENKESDEIEHDADMSDVQDDEYPQDGEKLDPHLKESEVFDLPEELQLDGDKADKGEPEDEDVVDEDLNGIEEGMEEVENEDIEDNDVDAKEESDTSLNGQEREDEEMANAEDTTNEENHYNDTAYGEEEGMTETMELGSGNMDDGQPIQDENLTKPESQGTGPEEASENQPVSAGSAERQAGAESQNLGDSTSKGKETNHLNEEEGAKPQGRDMETIRQLGSALEKWHRQHREIREALTDRTDESQEKRDVEMASQEFEHVPENAPHDTQALGAANEDQVQPLDDQMGIVSDELENKEPVEENESDKLDDEDMIMPDVDSKAEHLGSNEMSEYTETNAHSMSGAFIGERKNIEVELENDQDFEELDKVDDQLSTMQLDHESADPQATTDKNTMALWQHHEARTYALSQALTAQLRLILAPTLATKLRGDFRTGKRLNIKRIIPYIASSFKRDKIWMRRSVPTKRAYQVMLAIDDSRSMAEAAVLPTPNFSSEAIGSSTTSQLTSKDLAFDALALLARSLTTLEAGELSVVGFGKDVFVAQDFSNSLSIEAGADILRQFSFSQTRTDVKKLVQQSIEMFRAARQRQGSSSSSLHADLWQLQVIISDGICEDHEGIRRLLVRAREERILVVFVIVEASASGGSQTLSASNATEGTNKAQTSILDLETVEFTSDSAEPGTQVSGDGGMKLVRRRYLDTFPFQYYLVVKDIRDLPNVLAAALRQWFAEVAER